MHFSLRKTFSLLNTDRRARSDVPEELSANPAPRLQSWSLTRIEELIFGSSTQVAPKPFYISVASPSMYQPPASPHRPQTNTAKVDPESPTLESRVAALQTENIQLKEKIETLELDARICEEELGRFRSDYYAERFKANIRRRLVSASEARSQAQHDQLEQAEAFILSMIEVGLHQPVLSEAWQAVKAGYSSDEALVHAIKRAAAIPGTSWSSIIPAVIGTQPRDQNMYSIPSTWKARKDLHTTMKAAKFWKSPARTDPPTKTAPSSASDNSPTKNDTADLRNKIAVDNLLNKLRESKSPIRSPLSSKRGHQESVHTPKCIDRTSGRAGVSATKPASSSLNSVSNSVTLPEPPSPDRVQEYIPTPPSHATDLAPLASQTFKDERAACHHSPRRSRHSFSNQRRSALGKIDVNRNVQRLNSFRKATDKQGAKISISSAKALGKRKAIMVTEDMQIIAVGSPSLDKIHLAITETQPGQVLHSTLQQSSDASSTLRTVLDTGSILNQCVNNPAESAQTAQPLCDHGTLLPEKALLSLERICAGFSSGSLGSLAMISEDSKVNHPGAPVRNSLPNPQSVIHATKPKPLDPIIRTPPIFRKSVLPVLKLRRVVSVSSKSHLPTQPQTTSYRTPNVTSASTIFSKRLARTNTSPLRITKRTRPSASDIIPRKTHAMRPMPADPLSQGSSSRRFGSKRTNPVKGAPPVAF